MLRRAILATAVLAAARPAAAHSELRGSDPPDGAVLRVAPPSLVLRFNEPVQLTALRLFDAAGAEAPLRRTRDIAPRAEHRAGVPETLAPGAWRIEWRAISADGHPIGGALRFRLEPAAP